MKVYKRIASVLAKLEAWIIIVALLIAVGLTAVNVFSRYVLHSNFSWSEEVVVALMVLFCMIGAALCARDEGGLINMTIFTGKLPRRTQLVIETVTNALLMFFGGVILVSGWERCAAKIASGQVTMSLMIPEWIYNAFIPLGGFLLILHALERIFDGLHEMSELKENGGTAQ